MTTVIVIALVLSALIYGGTKLEAKNRELDRIHSNAPLDDLLPDAPLGKAIDPEFPARPNVTFHDDPLDLTCRATWCGRCGKAVPAAEINTHLWTNCTERLNP